MARYDYMDMDRRERERYCFWERGLGQVFHQMFAEQRSMLNKIIPDLINE